MCVCGIDMPKGFPTEIYNHNIDSQLLYSYAFNLWLIDKHNRRKARWNPNTLHAHADGVGHTLTPQCTSSVATHRRQRTLPLGRQERGGEVVHKVPSAVANTQLHHNTHKPNTCIQS